jgi:hypothetical protein
MPDQTFRAALDQLRQHTHSSATRPLISLLVQAIAMSRPVARILAKAELRTKAQRREAVIAATAALAAAADERRAQR